jgi:hypothetical protein
MAAPSRLPVWESNCYVVQNNLPKIGTVVALILQ